MMVAEKVVEATEAEGAAVVEMAEGETVVVEMAEARWWCGMVVVEKEEKMVVVEMVVEEMAAVEMVEGETAVVEMAEGEMAAEEMEAEMRSRPAGPGFKRVRGVREHPTRRRHQMSSCSCAQHRARLDRPHPDWSFPGTSHWRRGRTGWHKETPPEWRS